MLHLLKYSKIFYAAHVNIWTFFWGYFLSLPRRAWCDFISKSCCKLIRIFNIYAKEITHLHFRIESFRSLQMAHNFSFFMLFFRVFDLVIYFRLFVMIETGRVKYIGWKNCVKCVVILMKRKCLNLDRISELLNVRTFWQTAAKKRRKS